MTGLYPPGRAVLLATKRPALEATVREQCALADAVVIQGEARPYVVTVDEGPCAGLRLWAAERELAQRPSR